MTERVDLTPKQEKFCQAYVETSNGAEAYRTAYNSKAKPQNQAVEASKLLADPNIALRVEQIREATRANHNITLADILRELEEARVTALTAQNPQTSAAVAASMGKAKLLGFDKERKEPQAKDPVVINFVPAQAQNAAS